MAWFTEISEIVFRTSVVYLLMVAGMWMLGKKELSQISLTDLVFVLLISNSVQNAMVGENSTLAGGVAAALTLIAMNLIFRRLLFRYRSIRKILQGDPVVLVYRGKKIAENLNKEKITNDELMGVLREHGVASVEEVSLAMLETDGKISVLSEHFGKSTTHVRK